MNITEIETLLSGHVDPVVINLISNEFEDLKKQKAILSAIISRDRRAKKAAKGKAEPVPHSIQKICNAVSQHLSLGKRVYVFYRYASRGFTCRSKCPEAIDKLMFSDEHALVGAFVSAVKPSLIMERVKAITEEVTV